MLLRTDAGFTSCTGSWLVTQCGHDAALSRTPGRAGARPGCVRRGRADVRSASSARAHRVDDVLVEGPAVGSRGGSSSNAFVDLLEASFDIALSPRTQEQALRDAARERTSTPAARSRRASAHSCPSSASDRAELRRSSVTPGRHVEAVKRADLRRFRVKQMDARHPRAPHEQPARMQQIAVALERRLRDRGLAGEPPAHRPRARPGRLHRARRVFVTSASGATTAVALRRRDAASTRCATTICEGPGHCSRSRAACGRPPR